MAGALVLGTITGLTTATFAQGYYGGRYDGPAYGYRGHGYNYGPAVPNTQSEAGPARAYRQVPAKASAPSGDR